ncbi:MAG TPA: hypothetical protein VM124_00820 [Candidatus Limnocylindrales bacterium]|nr:hypothetical protein [Candidatus Limnocylindrales bacterium]
MPDMSGNYEFSEAELGGTLTRREGLTIAGAGLAALGLRRAFHYIEARQAENTRHSDEQYATDVLSQGLETYWDKLTVFPGLLVIDPAVQAYSDVSLGTNKKVVWANNSGQPILASRPFFVKASLDTHKDRYKEGSKSLARIIPELPEGLVAMWPPGPGKLVFFDAYQTPDLITPIYRAGAGLYAIDRPGDSIIGQNIKIDGREIIGNVSYPYLNRGHTESRPITAEEQKLRDRADDPNLDAATRGLISNVLSSGRTRVINFHMPLGHSVSVAEPRVLGNIIAAFQDDDGYEPIVMPNTPN